MEVKEDKNKELLNCLICMRLMSNVVRICINGHSICNRCINYQRDCSFCRYPWSKTRNRNLEKIMEQNSQINLENENLKCPKCHVLMDGGIILCGDGHSICPNCVRGTYQCVVCPKLISYKRNWFLENLIDMIKLTESMPQMQVNCPPTILPCCIAASNNPKKLYYHIISEKQNHKRVFFKYNKFIRLHLKKTPSTTFAYMKPVGHEEMFFIRLSYKNCSNTALDVELLELTQTKKFKLFFNSTINTMLKIDSKNGRAFCYLKPKFIMQLDIDNELDPLRSVLLRIKKIK